MVVIQMDSKISIHAPVKGATQPTLYGLSQSGYFNPRSREGSDLVRLSAYTA